MASYSGLAPVLRPLWRALNVPILTAHLILDPHQAAKHGAKDEMCRAGLCLPHIAASHISSRDEKGIVQCYISSSPTTLCKSFNVHRRPESSIPPIPISCLGCIWNIQWPVTFALTFEIANIFSYSVVSHDICQNCVIWSFDMPVLIITSFTFLTCQEKAVKSIRKPGCQPLSTTVEVSIPAKQQTDKNKT